MHTNDYKQVKTFTAFSKDFHAELTKQNIPTNYSSWSQENKEKIVTPGILWNDEVFKLNKEAIDEFSN